MEPSVNLSFTLPVSEAEKVLAFVKGVNPKEPSSRSVLKGVANGNEEEKRSDGSPDAPLHFEPVFLQQKRQELRYLLDQRLEQMIQFIVQRGGKFYNDELASELGVDDPQTSIFLGHLTRKLRKAGVSAEGFRGTNWYSKIRSSGRTLISVRSDVLVTLRKALED
ncbi:MAG: hypothetical protein DMG72_07850 [Acidobacteria bacterium]|nr:MAG: hypothetical protein DMG72_07850 [Acidobacteriota bacterium]